MSPLTYTLLSDGSSDRMLMPALDWLLDEHSREAFGGQWADLRTLPRPPKVFAERIARAVELFPCDLLFIHRDAEREPRENRLAEIEAAVPLEIADIGVPVIPVRMLEAWFLFDEPAIREAAGNPSGEDGLNIPAIKRVESVPDPKMVLEEALRAASALRGRRLQSMRLAEAKHRLSLLITDFSPLRALPAFAALEDHLVTALASKGWSP